MKSKDKVMASLLRDNRIMDFDLIAIQEPWRNSFLNTTHFPCGQHFEMAYLSHPETRTCFFINKKISRTKWTVTFHSPDLCTITLHTTDQGQEQAVHIHNIYNPGPHDEQSTIPLLQDVLTETAGGHHIVLGDFNLHHPYWGGNEDLRLDNEAEELMYIMEEHDMEQMLPPGSTTFNERGGKATIDLVFATPWIQERKVFCGTMEDLDHQSDHLPVATSILTGLEMCEPPERRQWQRTKNEILQLEFGRRLPPPAPLTTEQDIDRRVQQLVNAITAAIDASTPKARPSARSNSGWTQECKDAQMEARCLRRRYQRTRSDRDWEAYQEARNRKGRLIKKTLRDAHRARVQEASNTRQGLWRIAKWARNRGARQNFTPPFVKPDGGLEHNHQAKAHMLKEAFFPPPPTVDLSDITDQAYQNPINLPPITENEVHKAVKRMARNKAPGRDGIPTRILQQLLPQLQQHLVVLYNACLDMQYCPEHFRQSITVILPKPGKKDYTRVKSYRPIALLNTLSKVLETILAQRLAYIVEKYQLLPEDHVGGRKAMSTDHALHGLLERVYQAWNKGHVASLLLLDVSGAFDHVSHSRLLHNLRKRRIDGKTVGWIASFLQNRTTTIQLREFTSQPLQANIGVPQGSPMSLILYLFYNADILKQATEGNARTATGGWVDDIYFLAHSTSTEHNCNLLSQMHRQAERWSNTHGSKFDPSKYQLIHLTRNPRKYNTKQMLRLPNATIEPATTAKYLGVILDPPLRWWDHIQMVRAKATTTLAALRSIAGSTWGMGLIQLRQLYQTIVIPQITFGCSVWYAPLGERGHTRKMREALNKIQFEAARIIAGAFRATSAAALDVELYLLAMPQQMEKQIHQTALNILTGPLNLTLRATIERTISLSTGSNVRNPRNFATGYESPFQRLIRSIRRRLGSRAFDNLETREAFTVEPWWTPPSVTIGVDRETATQRHQDITTGPEALLAIYTDGSGINGKVGAAATAPTLGTQAAAYLGTADTATVYAAELLGILMGLNIGIRSGHLRLVIFADNQAALLTIKEPRRQSGQYIVKRIIQSIELARSKGQLVELHWIPAHQGTEGNELVDVLAKKATGWTQVRGTDGRLIERDTDNTAAAPDFLKHLRSAARTTIRKQTQVYWNRQWETETKGRTTYALTPTPTPKILQLHSSNHRAISSVIVQMRTQKIGLRHFLFERRVPDITDAGCECGRGDQTVRHILLSCPNYNDLRRTIWEGEDGRRPRMDLREILNTPKLARKAARFMILTRLLGQYGAVSENDITQGEH